MTELQRLATEFNEAEDRIGLTAEILPGETVILWLTRRLLTRLLPHLLGWLEQHPEIIGPAHLTSHASDMRQSFAQQVAAAQLLPLPPLEIGANSRRWLVNSVDVATTPQLIVLTFKGAEADDSARLSLSAQKLRQWLTIVHGQCRLAQWSMEAWPRWVADSALLRSEPASMLVH